MPSCQERAGPNDTARTLKTSSPDGARPRRYRRRRRTDPLSRTLQQIYEHYQSAPVAPELRMLSERLERALLEGRLQGEPGLPRPDAEPADSRAGAFGSATGQRDGA